MKYQEYLAQKLGKIPQFWQKRIKKLAASNKLNLTTMTNFMETKELFAIKKKSNPQLRFCHPQRPHDTEPRKTKPENLLPDTAEKKQMGILSGGYENQDLPNPLKNNYHPMRCANSALLEKNISVLVKSRIYNVYIQPISIYNCSTWVMNKTREGETEDLTVNNSNIA